MELLLIRHALPVRVDRSDGPADPVLAELGHRQAAALADHLADEPIAAVYVSPLRRARETSDLLCGRLGLAPVVHDGLAEFDRSADFYIPIEELRASGDPRWKALVAGDLSFGETVDPAEFAARVVEAVEAIVADHPGEPVAVVSHGGVVNAYLAHVLGLGDPLFFEPAYASVSRVLAARSGHRQIRSINETTHLRGLLPT